MRAPGDGVARCEDREGEVIADRSMLGSWRVVGVRSWEVVSFEFMAKVICYLYQTCVVDKRSVERNGNVGHE